MGEQRAVTINVLRDTWKELNQVKAYRETHDQLVRRLLKSYVESDGEVINA